MQQREVSVSRAELFEAAERIEKCWDPAHRYSGDAANLSLDVQPGGMFVERLPGGGWCEEVWSEPVAVEM